METPGRRPDVLGLDPSTAATGWALGDRTWTTKLPAAKFNPDEGGPDPDMRYGVLGDDLADLITENSIELIVIEDLVNAGRNAGHALKNGMVQGAFRYVAQNYEIPYLPVVGATLKKFATGNGAATKSDMAVAASKRADGIEFPNDNECDAWWLREFGLQWLGRPSFDLPEKQRLCLSVPKHIVGKDPR